MTFEPGDKLRHTLSEINYYLVGPVPNSDSLVVLTTENNQNAYIIDGAGLSQYYVKIPDLSMEKYKTYRRANTPDTAQYFVQDVFKNPESGIRVAFAWVTTKSGNTYHTTIIEHFFDIYEEVV